jgi:Fe-S-cluster containining protein
MTIPIKNITNENLEHSKSTLTCGQCRAACCQLEVMLLTDTGVPKQYINRDQWGSETMKQLDDGWCICVDRNTNQCTIYENRPWVCRIFEMGSYECSVEFLAV